MAAVVAFQKATPAKFDGINDLFNHIDALHAASCGHIRGQVSAQNVAELHIATESVPVPAAGEHVMWAGALDYAGNVGAAGSLGIVVVRDNFIRRRIKSGA